MERTYTQTTLRNRLYRDFGFYMDMLKYDVKNGFKSSALENYGKIIAVLTLMNDLEIINHDEWSATTSKVTQILYGSGLV